MAVIRGEVNEQLQTPKAKNPRIDYSVWISDD